MVSLAEVADRTTVVLVTLLPLGLTPTTGSPTCRCCCCCVAKPEEAAAADATGAAAAMAKEEAVALLLSRPTSVRVGVEAWRVSLGPREEEDLLWPEMCVKRGDDELTEREKN